MIPTDWQAYLENLIGEYDGNDLDLESLIQEILALLLALITQAYELGLYGDCGKMILSLMAFLEAVVYLCGDDLGITGAYVCFEGMGAIFGGLQGGVCLLFHPDKGWATYLYGGGLMGPMIAGGVAMVAGFWTWHGEKEFKFNDWTKWFYGPEGTVGIGLISVSGILFENDHITPTITGWGIGVGVGVGFGAAWSQTYYTRVFDWVMPPLLKRISVPE